MIKLSGGPTDRGGSRRVRVTRRHGGWRSRRRRPSRRLRRLHGEVRAAAAAAAAAIAATPSARPHLRHQGHLRHRRPRDRVRQPGLGEDPRARCRHLPRRPRRARCRRHQPRHHRHGRDGLQVGIYPRNPRNPRIRFNSWPQRSIYGENAHYGTPINPCAPGRVPGGSSSGSAVAVAANLVDFSLGTDTGGSVRVPAAYCAIFGLRPSHGLVSAQNVIPMAQIFDTVGWFARDLSILSRVTKVLLPLPDDIVKHPTQVTIPMDCFQILGSPDDRTYQIVNASVAKKFGSHAIDNANLGDFVSDNVPSIGKFIADFSESELPSVPALSVISHVMSGILRSQFKANHAEWVNSVKPNLGPGLREHIHEAVASGDDEPLEEFLAVRAEFKSALAALLKDHGILAIPTVPGPPPKVGMQAATLDNYQARAFSLLDIAVVSGFCQMSIPLGMRNGLPVSVSLVARHGADHFLLNVAEELYQTLIEEATKAWAS